jgi:hypothetical protein
MHRQQLEVSPPCSSATHPSPSILTHPGTSIPIDSPSEGFLAAEGYARTFFVHLPAMTADLLDAK